MQVFIMRHGEAVSQAASDSQRALTSNGRQQSQHMASWLLAQQISVEQILVSPYRRAIQTADAMRQVIAEQAPASINRWQQYHIQHTLTPNGDAGQVSTDLRLLAAQGISSLLVISHLPLVGYLVADLCPPQPPMMFATSAISCITLADHGNGVLNWYLSPDQLPALAG